MQPNNNNTFQFRKDRVLSKRDKSSAGRIDPHAVTICSVINDREEYYTTSSCAGRCFLYKGDGIKSYGRYAAAANDATVGGESRDFADDAASGGHDGAAKQEEEDPRGGLGFFERFRVNHDLIDDAHRYFDLSTLNPAKEKFDPTGGGDPIPTIGQFDFKKRQREEDGEGPDHASLEDASKDLEFGDIGRRVGGVGIDADRSDGDETVWLRFEPFVLHVCARTLTAAHALLSTARPAFKNVGLTSWKAGRYIVAIWGDEGLDMPLCGPDGAWLMEGREEWLKELVNERHRRNWSKIGRFVDGVRSMGEAMDDWVEDGMERDGAGVLEGTNERSPDKVFALATPKKFDVVGDVAILHSMPTGDETERERIGISIMKRNKAIKVCAARSASLSGTDRSPGLSGLTIIAGVKRSPLITTHTEYGIKCVVDLNRTFFTPRMGPERLRICQQVGRGENVLVLFSGVGMEAMQIAGQTEASSVMAVELNPVAVECAQRGRRMLERNKSVKCSAAAAERIRFMEGDVLDILPTLEEGTYDRILAPRPKEGKLDGDLGDGDGGVAFLEALIPLLKEVGGECHWYDFAADHELPECERIRQTVRKVCGTLNRGVEVIHVAQVGSVAKRQFRVCLDFRLTGKV